jgi:hypothetical protein
VKLLGFVDWVNFDKGGHRIAGVAPLYEITASEWRPVRSEEFPTQGKVFWFQANADKDTLLFFRAEENTGQFKDQFKVSEPQVALEVLDLRMIGSPEEVRQSLSAGLHRTGFVPGKAILWCDGDSFVGPVNLSLTGSSTYTFEHPQRHKIPCHTRKLDVREVSYGRVMRHVIAELSLGPPDSYVDWDDDKVVMRRAITWAVDRAKERGEEVKLTKHVIQKAAEQLTETGSSADLKLESYRLRRATEIIADLNLSEELARSALDILQNHQAVVSQLDQLRAEVRKTVTAEINESLAAKRAEIESLVKQGEQVISEIETARLELEGLRAQASAEVQEVEEEVNRRVGEVLEKPSALLAEVAILQAVLRGTNNSTASSNDSSIKRNRHSIVWSQSSKVITDQTELRKSLLVSCKAAGVPVRVSGRIHAAIQAGLMPLLAGPRALKALEAYARVTCGERMFRVNVAPSYLDPGDLFGKFDSEHGTFIPHPAGLADVLEHARQDKRLALVVIEGVNRAPTESYLLPVIQCAFSNFHLHLLHPSLASPEDPYRALAEIRWPSNVLLSASIVEGATTLPLCRDLWNASVLVETDGDAPKPSPAPDVAELDPEGTLIGTESLTAVEAEFFEALPGFESLREASEHYLSALLGFEGNREQQVRIITESILLPFAASIEDEVERGELLRHLTEVCKPAGLEQPELESMVRRIRRRIA